MTDECGTSVIAKKKKEWCIYIYFDICVMILYIPCILMDYRSSTLVILQLNQARHLNWYLKLPLLIQNVIASARIYNSVICCILHGALRWVFFKRIWFFIDIARYTTRAIIFYDVFINTGISYTYNYYFIGLLSYTIVYT